MGFKSDAFIGAALAPRTAEIQVPDLAAWFDGPAVWTVRGVDANDLARAEQAKGALRREAALAKALSSGSASEVIKEVQAALGRSQDVEPDTARRLHLLVAGSVEPACSMELAVRLAEHYPVVFYQLTNRVLELTGQGSDAEKKPRSSGKTGASDPPSS